MREILLITWWLFLVILGFFILKFGFWLMLGGVAWWFFHH